jgi:hypothetical protein
MSPMTMALGAALMRPRIIPRPQLHPKGRSVSCDEVLGSDVARR